MLEKECTTKTSVFYDPELFACEAAFHVAIFELVQEYGHVRDDACNAARTCEWRRSYPLSPVLRTVDRCRWYLPHIVSHPPLVISVHELYFRHASCPCCLQRAIDATSHQRQPRDAPIFRDMLREVHQVGKVPPAHHCVGLRITVREGELALASLCTPALIAFILSPAFPHERERVLILALGRPTWASFST